MSARVGPSSRRRLTITGPSNRDAYQTHPFFLAPTVACSSPQASALAVCINSHPATSSDTERAGRAGTNDSASSEPDAGSA